MLALHEWGDPAAPALLLVHGLTESAAAWPDAVARWSSRYSLSSKPRWTISFL